MSRRVRDLLVLAGIVAVYFAAGKVGLSLATVNASTTAVWPPTGIAVAALLLFGQRAWPAIAVGAWLVNYTTSGAVIASIAIAAGNTCEALAAAWLTTRYANGRAAFARAADIIRFTVGAVVFAPAVSATIGTLTLWTAGLAPASDIYLIWVTWWVGDAVGLVVIAPLCLLWTERWEPVRGGPLEGLALSAALLATAWFIFGASPLGVMNLPLAFLIMPIVLWSAFRFGSRVTAVMAAVISVLALSGTLHGFGPFVTRHPGVSLLMAQAFVGVTTLVMLSVAAEVATRRRIEHDIRTMNETLERRVEARSEELMRLHGRLVEAQDVAHVGSWEWDMAGDTVWWSDELYRIWGLEPGTPLDFTSYVTNLHPDDRERVGAAVQQAGVDGRPYSIEHRIVRASGEVRIIHGTGRVIMAGGRPSRMMGVAHDITELKRAEEERAQLIREQAARREAEDANRAKDQFLATLSHELRTPLNAAMGWTHILRDALGAEGRDARAIDAIQRNQLLQARLVSDILDVSRIAKGSLPLETGPVDLVAVVGAALETVRDPARGRQIDVTVQVAGGVPCIQGDGRRLQQVAWNLLSNAVKFAPDGGRVSVSIGARDRWLELVVADNGPGIAPEFLPHVFEQFRQADQSVTRTHGGLGLGLAIAQHIVESHGGRISAANRSGGGAVFTVLLPKETR